MKASSVHHHLQGCCHGFWRDPVCQWLSAMCAYFFHHALSHHLFQGGYVAPHHQEMSHCQWVSSVLWAGLRSVLWALLELGKKGQVNVISIFSGCNVLEWGAHNIDCVFVDSNVYRFEEICNHLSFAGLLVEPWEREECSTLCFPMICVPHAHDKVMMEEGTPYRVIGVFKSLGILGKRIPIS